MPVTLYSQTEIQHALDALPAQDWPTAFGMTIHGERLFPAVVVEPLLAAHDAERLAAEHLAWIGEGGAVKDLNVAHSPLHDVKGVQP
jgi:hypothetical protein